MTKQIFTQSQQPEEEEILPKQEFYNVETTIDNEPLEGELLDRTFIFRSNSCAICSMDLG